MTDISLLSATYRELSPALVDQINAWHRDEHVGSPLITPDVIAEFCFDGAWEECIEEITADEAADQFTGGEIHKLPDEVANEVLNRLDQMLLDHDMCKKQ